MKYEVEQKFRVSELAPVENELRHLGACFEPAIEQADGYFAHPVRDFAVTDEALRIRRVGEECYLTYKGPKIDATTKTRAELELPLFAQHDYVEQFTALLEVLGFRRIAEVRKLRRKATLAWSGAQIEVALDAVENVGQFVELELVADAAGVETARRQIAELAGRLRLSHNERRSYLELLLGS